VLIAVLGALAHRRRELTAVWEASSETIQRLCVAVEARRPLQAGRLSTTAPSPREARRGGLSGSRKRLRSPSKNTGTPPVL
jgi:HAMP domain-containing protein